MHLNFSYEYNKYFEAFCIKLCCLNVLSFYGISDKLLFVNAVPTFSLINDIHGKPYFTFDMEPLVYSHKNNMNIHTIKDKVASWELMMLHINNGYPCLINVDGFFLPYHPSYHKEHEEHTIVLYGYDSKTCTVQLADNMPPYFYAGSLNKDIFFQALGEQWGVLEKIGWTNYRNRLIYETLSSTLLSLYNEKNNFSGMDALEQYIGWICSYSSCDTEFFRTIHTQIGNLSNYLILFAHYIYNANKINSCLGRLCNFLENWLRNWRILRISLLKNIHSSKHTQEYKSLLPLIYNKQEELKILIKNCLP